MQEVTIPIVLQSQKGETRGTALLHVIPREDAIRRAAFAWIGAWGMAIVTLPIPLVHFVAPPLLLLLGPLAALVIYKIFNGAVDVARADVRCPDCSAGVPVGPCAERWPLALVCPACDARLNATRVDQPL